jgi:hypothetical protein
VLRSFTVTLVHWFALKDQITGGPEAHEATNTALLDNLVAFIPDLAMSFDNLSNRLVDLGYQEEVLESILSNPGSCRKTTSTDPRNRNIMAGSY